MGNLWPFGPFFLLVLLEGFCDGVVKLVDDPSTTDQKYKVFRVVPRTQEQLSLLQNLFRRSTDFELNFWKEPTGIGVFSDIMVPPEYIQTLGDFLNKGQLEYNIIIEDVQRMIEQREGESQQQQRPKFISSSTNTSDSALLLDFFSKRMKDDASGGSSYVSRNRAQYGFGDYHSYAEITNWMDQVEYYYPQMARVFTIGTTFEGRPIKGIKIGNPINDISKRAVWIDGGIHAREWASIHTALYFIDQLISDYGVDPQITTYVNTLNFYVTPVANPDGFEYSRSDVTPQTRFWRKNKGPQVCRKDRWSRMRCCSGVDLNRNFDFHWGESGSSDDICSDIYQGQSAFSEPESRAIRDKMLSPELYGKVDAFITLHTYSQMWIHPFNHERRSFPDDVADLQDVGRRGVRAIEQVYGTRYRFGTGADILYPSAGGSDDWAKAKAYVKYVYLLELRPGEDEWDGFLLDRRQLVPTGKETWEGVKVVVDAVMRRAQPQLPVSISPPTAPPTTVLLTTTSPVRFPQQQWTIATPLTLHQNLVQQSNDPFIPPQTRRINEQSNTLRNSLHEKLARLRQQQERKQTIVQGRSKTGCDDKSQWCMSWIRAAPSICKTSTVYMRQDCKRSCGFCSPTTG